MLAGSEEELNTGRGIHSHSWQSRKNKRTAAKKATLVRGAAGFPSSGDRNIAEQRTHSPTFS
jgi:hypothetical protein